MKNIDFVSYKRPILPKEVCFPALGVTCSPREQNSWIQTLSEVELLFSGRKSSSGKNFKLWVPKKKRKYERRR